MPTPIDRHIRWMEQRGLRPNTIYHRRMLLARAEHLIAKPLLEATHDDLAAWRESLVGTAGTIACKVSAVRGFYRWAYLEHLIDQDPSLRIMIPRRPPRLPRPIPERDLKMAIMTAPPRVRPFLVLAAYCGLRAQEIAYLTAQDIVVDGPTPHLVVSEQGAKGGKPRIVPLGQTAILVLRGAELPKRGYVFLRQDGRPGPNKPHMVSQLSNQHLHGLGITHTLHSLRHRFGTKLYHVSQDLRMVAAVMGHSDTATTAGYVAYSQASAIAAVGALDVA